MVSLSHGFLWQAMSHQSSCDPTWHYAICVVEPTIKTWNLGILEFYPNKSSSYYNIDLLIDEKCDNEYL